MPRLLHHLIDEAAHLSPEAEAVRADGEAITYGQLLRRANGVARALHDTGIEPHARVGVLLPRGLNVPVAFYGVVAAGAVLVPIDPRSPAQQVARILSATGATHLITKPSLRRVANDAVDSCPTLRHVLGLEADDDPPNQDLQPNKDLTRARLPWSAIHELASDTRPAVRTIDLDPVYVLHTSGSTGIPKLIRHTHRSALAFVDWAADTYALTPDDRLSNHSSHHTCFATFDYYAAARARATTVVLTPASLVLPASLAALLEEEAISVWYSVPTALVHLALRGDLASKDLSALRWVLFAGETFPEKHLQSLRQQLPQARFSHVYGSTEVNVCTYYHLPDGPLPSPLPIGQACSTDATLVVDEALEPVPHGEVGELLVRGATVMSGYWDDPERNHQVLVRRPAAGGFDEIYFRTGDRVRADANGDLAFVARADLQVKVRGFRVELQEVETALLANDAVESAVALAQPDGEGSSTLIAAVVLTAESDADERSLRGELGAHLPAYAVPGRIEILERFPRTPTDKVDRKALKAELTR
ncbi:MAG: amino acid adenylation domain-containing protein [Acidobacteriota bacterium]